MRITEIGAWTPASGRTPGMRRPVRTITRPSISLRRMALGLPTSPLPSGVIVAALIPNPSSRRAAAASSTAWFLVFLRSPRERSKSRFAISNPSTSGSRRRSASRSSSSPVWSPCRTAMVGAAIDRIIWFGVLDPRPDPPPLVRGRGSRLRPDGRGAGERSDVAELHHHAELVGNTPVLDDLSILDPHHVDHVGERLDPGRGMAGEAAKVGAAAFLAGPHLVARHDNLVDRDLEVGERGTQVLDHVLRSFDAVS